MEKVEFLQKQYKYVDTEDLLKAVIKYGDSEQLENYLKEKNKPPKKELHILLDDSNLWVEGKKLAAHSYHQNPLKDTPDDKRYRIDLGNLIELIVGKRDIQVFGHLYGSKPPPNDTVWKAAKKKNWTTEIFERQMLGQIPGSEKEVDNAISTQATKIAEGAKFKKRTDFTTLALITGDRDMRPTVLSALNSGVSVELWSWKHSRASVYEVLLRQYPQEKFQLKDLTPYIKTIGFISYKSTFSNSMISPSHSIVIEKVQNAKEEEFFISLIASICPRLFYISELFQGEKNPNSPRDVVFDFPKSNLEEITKDLERKHNVIWKTYYQYKNTANPDQMIYSHYEYNLEVQDEEESETQYSDENKEQESQIEKTDPENNNNNNKNNWKKVEKVKKISRVQREGMKRTECLFSFQCKQGTECKFSHSKDEIEVFQNHNGVGYSSWKTKNCEIQAPHIKKICHFAHGEEDAWCSDCSKLKIKGPHKHWTNACPYKK